MSNTGAISWPNTNPLSTPIDIFVGWLKKNTEITSSTPILEEGYDNFTYPPLMQLRKEFEASGLYTKDQIDGIIKSYERLPKYQTGGSDTSRGRARG